MFVRSFLARARAAVHEVGSNAAPPPLWRHAAMPSARRTRSPATPPASVLVLSTPRTEFMLHPPRERAFSFDTSRCVLWVPFGSTSADLHVAGQRQVRARIRAGAAWFFSPGTAVRARVQEPVELLALAVDPARLNEIAGSVAGSRAWRARDVMDVADPGIEGVAREVRRTMLGDRLPAEAYLQALVDAILARLVCHLTLTLSEAQGTATLTPARLQAVFGHIEEHLDQPLRVEQLADMVGLSRSHFSRAFQHVTGQSPQRFITSRRLCRARALLLSSAANLALIASQSGFSSHAHMTAVFRKEIGVTPTRYRSAYAGEAEVLAKTR